MSILMLALAAATLVPPQFGEIKLSTGVRLHYAEQGPATGEVIITLHGYSDSWFSFSGVMPLLADRYKVISILGDGFWRRAFGADPSVIGRTITLNSQPYTIVGVLPASFAWGANIA